MKKLIAILLASMLVACCFAVSASADSNLVAGSTNYTLTSDDEVVAYNSAAVGDDNCPPSDTSEWLGLFSGQVTDGAVRSGTEDSPIASDAVMGKTIELTGSLRT